MKNKILSIFIIIITIITFSIISMPTVYGDDSTEPSTTAGSSSSDSGITSDDEDDGSWVGDAFQAAYDFLNEEQEDDGIALTFLNFFTNIVRAINRILLILLAGLSIVSLAIVGAKYIIEGMNPRARDEAQAQMRTVFMGMLYGFGAFMIWNVAMAIVRIIIGAFGSGD